MPSVMLPLTFSVPPTPGTSEPVNLSMRLVAGNNSTSSLSLTITNVGVLRNGGNPDIATNIIGSAFAPQTAETFCYDLDGNMTNDGHWSITWDGENRVTSFARRSGVAGPNTSLQCVSDYMGRRVSKSDTGIITKIPYGPP